MRRRWGTFTLLADIAPSAAFSLLDMGFMTDEIELKLELSPVDAERIITSDLFAGEGKTARLLSVYFDTAGRAVTKAGYSLRIRRSGDTRIQTIKADGAKAAGLFMRSEWERAVDDDAPLLDHTTPLRAVLGDAADDVMPLFAVQVDRRRWMVDEDASSIEVVLDRGEVVAGSRKEAICEIELELKFGDPASLFGLARKIDAIVPVRIGVVTKSERGYRLTDPFRDCHKAEAMTLRGDISTADAFRLIVQSCIRQFRLNETLLLETRERHALHQARVAVRRMRSAFSIFKPMIGDDGSELRQELRWLASILGEARNLDVLLERAVPGRLHEQISAVREASYDGLFEQLGDHRARSIMLNVAHWLEQGRWTDREASDVEGTQPARAFAASALRRFRRRIKRRGEGLADVNDKTRHEVRKDAKKLRYASEFFASLFGRQREQRRYKRFVAALAELQDRLGALNDVATAPEVLARHGLADQDGVAALVPHDFDRKKMLRRAEYAYGELFDTKKFW